MSQITSVILIPSDIGNNVGSASSEQRSNEAHQASASIDAVDASGRPLLQEARVGIEINEGANVAVQALSTAHTTLMMGEEVEQPIDCVNRGDSAAEPTATSALVASASNAASEFGSSEKAAEIQREIKRHEETLEKLRAKYKGIRGRYK